MFSKRSVTVSASVIGLTFVGAILTYATIPAPSGVIYGCYNKSGGSIRVIDNEVTKCSSNETQLTWNQTGPQGLMGLPGPQGTPGVQGPAGSPGATGPVGPSHAYITQVASTTTAGTGALGSLTVAGPTVPAGAYVVDAKA